MRTEARPDSQVAKSITPPFLATLFIAHVFSYFLPSVEAREDWRWLSFHVPSCRSKLFQK
jgi:hypothetical protein